MFIGDDEDLEDWAQEVEYSDDEEDDDEDDDSLDSDLAEDLSGLLLPPLAASSQSMFLDDIISTLRDKNPFGIPLTGTLKIIGASFASDSDDCDPKEEEYEFDSENSADETCDGAMVNEFRLVAKSRISSFVKSDATDGAIISAMDSASATVSSASARDASDVSDVKQDDCSSAVAKTDPSDDSAFLGRGTFADVFSAVDTRTHTAVALKRLRKRQLNKKMVMKSHIVDGIPRVERCTVLHLVQREVEMLLSVDKSKCQYITSLREVIDDRTDDRLFLVLELSPFGQVSDWNGYFMRYVPNAEFQSDSDCVRQCKASPHISAKMDLSTRKEPPRVSFTEARTRALIYCLVSAVAYIHSLRIIHRDLKPDNMLLFSKDVCKICDFGTGERLAVESEGRVNDTQGTIHFFSPGACNADEDDGLRNGFKDDVWAVGVVMFTFVYGTVPFHNATEHLLMEAIASEEVIYDASMPFSDSGMDLLKQLLHKDESQRPEAAVVLEHDWFKQS